MSKVEELLGGEAGGFAPKKPTANEDVLAQQLFGEDEDDDLPLEAAPAAEAAPSPDQGDGTLGQEPAPAAPQADVRDLETLRSAGWTDDDLEGISPAAAARHAAREVRRLSQTGQAGTDDRRRVSSERDEADDVEQVLAEELGKSTAKKVGPVIRKLLEGQRTLERSVAQQRVERVKAEHIGKYPELGREAALEAAVQLAVRMARPGDTDAQAFSRALSELYGPRTAAKPSPVEARSQLEGQMTSPGRAPKRAPPTKDDVRAAAWREFEKTGNVNSALDVRQRLGG